MEWIYNALEAFQAFMDNGTLADAVLIVAISALGAVLTIAIHECGHALAALLSGRSVREMRIGDVDDVTVKMGAFRLRLGRLLGKGDTGGYVIYDARGSAPQHVMAIALAGPVANLVAAAVSAVVGVHEDGMLAVVLFLWSFANFATAVANLRAGGDPDVPAEWTDGSWVRAAWAARRLHQTDAAATADPNTETSVPPPPPRPADTPLGHQTGARGEGLECPFEA